MSKHRLSKKLTIRYLRLQCHRQREAKSGDFWRCWCSAPCWARCRSGPPRQSGRTFGRGYMHRPTAE